MLDRSEARNRPLSSRPRAKTSHRASPSALRHISSQRRCHPPLRSLPVVNQLSCRMESTSNVTVSTFNSYQAWLPVCPTARGPER